MKDRSRKRNFVFFFLKEKKRKKEEESEDEGKWKNFWDKSGGRFIRTIDRVGLEVETYLIERSNALFDNLFNCDQKRNNEKLTD